MKPSFSVFQLAIGILLVLWFFGDATATAATTIAPAAENTVALQPAMKAPTISDIACFGEGRSEKMDAWLPPERSQKPVPAVLLIHGGGWEVGDKADPRERNIAGTLAANGYAVFSINYLLAKKTTNPETGKAERTKMWPQCFYDCKSALRYLRANASLYGIDPNRIAVMGGSAGGHLALLVGVTARVNTLNQGGLYSAESNEVSCIIDLYGIHDLRQFGRWMFLGDTPQETERNLTVASPVTYFGTDAIPPVLVIHGSADKTVPVSVSHDLVSRLRAKNCKVEYVEVEGAGHSFHLQPAQMDLRPVVIEFLRRHLSFAQN